MHGRVALNFILFCICVTGASTDGTGTTEEDDCLENCLTNLQQEAPDLDAQSVLSIGHIRVGNEAVVCPKYNPEKMNRTCGSYLKSQECLDTCPDSEVKRLSMSGFVPLQFLCVDRKEDVQRNMPCLTEVCPTSEASCAAHCGSFDDLSKDLLQLITQIRGNGDQNSNVPVDPNNVTMTISKACEGIQCYADCSRNSTVAKCGQEAYKLEIDIVWTMFVSMTQSISSIGLSTLWPDKCNTLASRSEGQSQGQNGQIVAPPSAIPVTTTEAAGTTTRSNFVQQFVEKVNEEVNTIASTTAKCDGPNCSTAPVVSGSAVAVITCLLTALIKW